jgi:hypothetical protein
MEAISQIHTLTALFPGNETLVRVPKLVPMSCRKEESPSLWEVEFSRPYRAKGSFYWLCCPTKLHLYTKRISWFSGFCNGQMYLYLCRLRHGIHSAVYWPWISSRLQYRRPLACPACSSSGCQCWSSRSPSSCAQSCRHGGCNRKKSLNIWRQFTSTSGPRDSSDPLCVVQSKWKKFKKMCSGYMLWVNRASLYVCKRSNSTLDVVSATCWK